ncbi:hypothetical protein Tco_0871030 [Tanacetum coccineum]
MFWYSTAFNTVKGDKPLKVLMGAPGSSEVKLDQYDPLFIKKNGTNQNAVGNVDVLGPKDQSGDSSNSFSDDQYKRLMSLISENSGSSSMPTNIAGINYHNSAMLVLMALTCYPSLSRAWKRVTNIKRPVRKSPEAEAPGIILRRSSQNSTREIMHYISREGK